MSRNLFDASKVDETAWHLQGNWAPVKEELTVSDLEVKSSEEEGSLWYIKYKIDENHYLSIATTRPETMLGDTAVAVNTHDPRYKKLIGKEIVVPIVNRIVHIIADDYIKGFYLISSNVMKDTAEKMKPF